MEIEKFLIKELQKISQSPIKDLTESLLLLKTTYIYLIYNLENDVWIPYLVDNLDEFDRKAGKHVIYTRYELFIDLSLIL